MDWGRRGTIYSKQANLNEHACKYYYVSQVVQWKTANWTENLKNFSVLEFIDEAPIEVIPLTWIEPCGQKCKFPDEPRQKISKLRSNKNSKRCDSWSSYVILVHFNSEPAIVLPQTRQYNNNTAIETDALETFSEMFFTEFRKFEVSVLNEIHRVKADVEILRSIATRKSPGKLLECPTTLPNQSEVELKIDEEKLVEKLLWDKLR
ncbi:unnamed protein product [Allacma fusca]|uniref:Uncharacterized protein n=1 Tax=Allacma fusca TaxID=39272 RepID=A0A8J2P2B0_9HEXA|nr:unnamed protein product [Allacma fusca]